MRDSPLSPREAKLADIERLIRRDPARRGLIEADSSRGPLCPGHLAAAADHLARFGKSVGIVTGFFIPGATPPAAETDGPPGAALLAATLSRCGMSVRLITDEPCAATVTVAAREYGLADETVLALPVAWNHLVVGWDESASPTTSAIGCRRLQNGYDFVCERRTPRPVGLADSSHPTPTPTTPIPTPFSHLIAVERVGPAHSLRSFAGRRAETDPVVDQFRQHVPSEHQDRCHNMRGEIIDAHTAPLHRLFEGATEQQPGVRTIGIGDGGNEIGMGSIPWDELRSRLTGPAAPLVPCRVPTDWTIVAGVSNWGAQALAAAVCLLRGEIDILSDFDVAAEERRLRAIVQDGPAVDGVTRLGEATVDGLPFLTYMQPWDGMRRLLGCTK